MPHLITIIKYARAIVKYILALLCVVAPSPAIQSAIGFVASNISRVFCFCYTHKWVRLGNREWV
jgi:hypothetical protein